MAHPYRTMILRAMETVVSGHIGELDKDMARAIILLASSEMTRVKVWAHLCGLGEGSLFTRTSYPSSLRMWSPITLGVEIEAESKIPELSGQM